MTEEKQILEKIRKECLDNKPFLLFEEDKNLLIKIWQKAEKEERENHIRTLDYIINGWVSNANIDIVDWCKELKKQLNNED
jgi:hypothetical protein